MKNIKCRNCFFYRNEWCKKIVDSPDPEEVRDCAYFREMTNADKIRSMSDEELAGFLSFNGDVEYCHAGMCKAGETCRICCLKWLQQPAGEEDKNENLD